MAVGRGRSYLLYVLGEVFIVVLEGLALRMKKVRKRDAKESQEMRKRKCNASTTYVVKTGGGPL